MSLMEIIRFEKKQLNRIRFIMNYVVTPIFLFITFSGLALGAVLMSINEAEYTPAFIWILITIGIIMIILLSINPFVRKKEIEIELSKRDYNTSGIEDKDECEFILSDEECVILKESGLMFNEIYLNYDEFEIQLKTTNKLNLVNIFISFTIISNKEIPINENEVLSEFHLELSKELIYTMAKFNIKLKNQDVLDYIINNKKLAFEQIYKYGSIKKI